MSVAVLILGEFREFEIAVKSWDFVKNDNIDYYISTWSESNQEIKEEITEDKYRKHLQDKIKSIQILDKNLVPRTLDGNYDTPQAARYHWLRTWELLLHLSSKKVEHLKYDYIFLTRPDIWYNLPNDFLKDSFLKKIKDNTIYTNEYGVDDNFFVQDIYFLGTYKTMMNFMKNCAYSPIEHFTIAKKIKENFISDSFGKDLAGFIVRPNVRKVPEHLLSRDVIYEKNLEWSKWKQLVWENK